MVTKQVTNELPHGAGSIYLRGNIWWIVYKDATGRRQSVTTGSNDRQFALRLGAHLAIGVLQSKIEALQEILNETPIKAEAGTEGHAAVEPSGKYDARRRSLCNDAAKRGTGKAARATGKGGRQ